MTERQFFQARQIGLALLVVFPVQLFENGATAAELRGSVVGIADGDTLTLLTEEREQHRLRMSAIDAPDGHQPYRRQARQELSDLAFGKEARAIVVDVDRYGRPVVRLFVDGLDVNAEMVRRGAAWVHRRYSDDPELLRLEQEARVMRRGLWALPEAERIPPWQWRAAVREERRQRRRERGGCGGARPKRSLLRVAAPFRAN